MQNNEDAGCKQKEEPMLDNGEWEDLVPRLASKPKI